jgi:hypothetical protein
MPASAGWRCGSAFSRSFLINCYVRFRLQRLEGSWRETDNTFKAKQDWVNIHAAIEVDKFLVLGYSLTGLKVHDS